eukprot:5034865-Prymnesium_polylepis.1
MFLVFALAASPVVAFNAPFNSEAGLWGQPRDHDRIMIRPLRRPSRLCRPRCLPRCPAVGIPAQLLQRPAARCPSTVRGWLRLGLGIGPAAATGCCRLRRIRGLWHGRHRLRPHGPRRHQ